jgi:quercetin 2,3-dioxygenase
VTVQAGEASIRFLLVSAWRGPIVMNTNEELQQAFSELRAGTFIQNR